MNTKDFILEIKEFVYYDKHKKVHNMGDTILTKNDMRTMLSNYYKDQFPHLKWSEQSKVIDSVFKELKANGKTN